MNKLATIHVLPGDSAETRVAQFIGADARDRSAAWQSTLDDRWFGLSAALLLAGPLATVLLAYYA